jgi:hypothetical protein
MEFLLCTFYDVYFWNVSLLFFVCCSWLKSCCQGTPSNRQKSKLFKEQKMSNEDDHIEELLKTIENNKREIKHLTRAVECWDDELEVHRLSVCTHNVVVTQGGHKWHKSSSCASARQASEFRTLGACKHCLPVQNTPGWSHEQSEHFEPMNSAEHSPNSQARLWDQKLWATEWTQPEPVWTSLNATQGTVLTISFIFGNARCVPCLNRVWQCLRSIYFFSLSIYLFIFYLFICFFHLVFWVYLYRSILIFLFLSLYLHLSIFIFLLYYFLLILIFFFIFLSPSSLSIYQSIYQYLSFYRHIFLSIYLSVCLSVRLSVRPSIHPSIHLLSRAGIYLSSNQSINAYLSVSFYWSIY